MTYYGMHCPNCSCASRNQEACDEAAARATAALIQQAERAGAYNAQQSVGLEGAASARQPERLFSETHGSAGGSVRLAVPVRGLTTTRAQTTFSINEVVTVLKTLKAQSSAQGREALDLAVRTFEGME